MKPILHFPITTLMLLAPMIGSSLAADPDTFSPVVSYQYLDSLSGPGTEYSMFSRVVSYQYIDWPGNENLAFTNSPNVSYYFNGPPQIVTQPASQLLRAGATATLSVVADGMSPLSYQWRFNGQPLPDTAGATIALDDLQSRDSGVYSVEVSNASGSVTSRDARLIVYQAPVTQQPAIPTCASSTGSLSGEQTNQPRMPSSAQMKVLPTGTTMDPNKITIVMTHGWNSNSGEWPTSMAAALSSLYATKANIVAWDWRDNASAVSPAYAAGRSVSEGTALGNALMDTLEPTYNKPIHFIGHSLGTLVNRAAADYMHGDDRPTNDSRSTSQKFDSMNTHITLLDEAELVTAVKGLHVALDVLLVAHGISYNNAFSDAAQQIKYFWSKVIPDHSFWVDNYVSEVGLLDSDACNVLLWRATANRNPAAAHGYSCYWYEKTVRNPLGGLMGHRWSFERDTIRAAPPTNVYFLQEKNSAASELVVSQISAADALILRGSHIVAYPSLQAYKGLSAIENVVQGVYLDGIQYAGNMVVNFAETFSAPKGTPVYLGTAGSTAAYFLPADQMASTDLQASWDFQFSIQPGAPHPQRLPKGSVPMPRGAPSAGPVFSILPVHVPNEAVGVSFEYSVTDVGVDDFITMGIESSNEYTMETKFLDNGVWNGTPVIPISDHHNQDVRLVFALNGGSGVPTGILSVRNIQFYIPPMPQVALDKAGSTLTASWPLSALDWTLETTTDLSDPNGWQPVAYPPNDTDFFHTMMFDISTTNRAFFRLRK
jgi:hypothetical protein